MNEPLESLRPPPVRPARTNRPPARSPGLAWAITLGESVLLAGAAVPLFKYWLMFPVPIRLGGITVLAALTLLIIFRMVRFHLRRSRQRTQMRGTLNRRPDVEPEPASAWTPSKPGKTGAAAAESPELRCKKRFAILTS